MLPDGDALLQLDRTLIEALHARGFRIAVATNGTIAAPEGIDWICVSPKASAPLVQTQGHALKLVYPQPNLMPDALPWSTLHFEHYLLQPLDGPITLPLPLSTFRRILGDASRCKHTRPQESVRHACATIRAIEPPSEVATRER